MACVELNHLEALLQRLLTLAPSAALQATLRQATLTSLGICGALQDVLRTSTAVQSSLPYEAAGYGRPILTSTGIRASPAGRGRPGQCGPQP